MPNSNPKICGIYFDYDAVGNRVKRTYDCRNVDEKSEDPSATASSRPAAGGKPRKAAPQNTSEEVTDPLSGAQTTALLLFPNPTTGPLTLRLASAPETPLHFHWYNEALQILGSGSISTTEYKSDISAWPDGIYTLRLYRADEVYSFRVIKVTGAGSIH